MVLRLKTRESRSLPGLQRRESTGHQRSHDPLYELERKTPPRLCRGGVFVFAVQMRSAARSRRGSLSGEPARGRERAVQRSNTTTGLSTDWTAARRHERLSCAGARAFGAPGPTRTGTLFPATDFESAASTDSATEALRGGRKRASYPAKTCRQHPCGTPEARGDCFETA